VVLAVIGTVPLPRRGFMIELERDPQAAINRRRFTTARTTNNAKSFRWSRHTW
jgi:hypothetical protein